MNEIPSFFFINLGEIGPLFETWSPQRGADRGIIHKGVTAPKFFKILKGASLIFSNFIYIFTCCF